MTRLLQCLTSVVVLALVLGQSAHCAVVKRSSVPVGKTILYKQSETDINGHCDVTPLFIDKAEYEKRCGEKSDSKWPCFKTSDDTSIKYTTIEPWLEPLNMSEEILLMDENASAFTLRDASVPFTIKFPYGVRLTYYDYNDKTGCYKIHLEGRESFRIFVSDGNGNDRDIDTLHYWNTGKQLCSKWITIGTLIRDGNTSAAESDNRGI
ncbi:related to Mig1 protein [Ustilago bromivora]|uniref:Related to Mig1 protein n=1 Tax=Ustilago bromivora TaxID=307758 RepID=A0A1K0G5L5_9BASI|nr:related to Mig1 protein [Ustilago bromivora]